MNKRCIVAIVAAGAAYRWYLHGSMCNTQKEEIMTLI